MAMEIDLGTPSALVKILFWTDSCILVIFEKARYVVFILVRSGQKFQRCFFFKEYITERQISL